MTLRSTLFPLVLLLTAACGADDALFKGSQSAALGAAGNQAECATCHSADGSLGASGNSLKDIAHRTSFKGGGAMTLLDGANACITGWMGGKALATSNSQWMSLEAYLKSISDPKVTSPNALAPEVLANEAAYEAAYAGGDATKGEAKFTSACGTCHGAALQVGSAKSPARASLAGKSIGRIAQKVRTSGPPPSGSADATDTTPGPMPFFEPKDLSVADLKDIIAYVKLP